MRNDRTIINHDVERTWKGSMACFKALFWQLHGKIKDDDGEPCEWETSRNTNLYTVILSNCDGKISNMTRYSPQSNHSAPVPLLCYNMHEYSCC